MLEPTTIAMSDVCEYYVQRSERIFQESKNSVTIAIMSGKHLNYTLAEFGVILVERVQNSIQSFLKRFPFLIPRTEDVNVRKEKQ